jgi:hypothetical protein
MIFFSPKVVDSSNIDPSKYTTQKIKNMMESKQTYISFGKEANVR